MALTKEELFQIDLQGYYVKKGVFSPEEVRRIVDALKGLEGRKKEELPEESYPAYMPEGDEYRLYNFIECDEVFLNLVDHPEIMRFVREVVQHPPRLILPFSITRRKGPGNTLHHNEIGTYRVENGRPRSNYFTAAIALSDVGPGDGPFVLFTGTHKSTYEWPYENLHPKWNKTRDPKMLEYLAGGMLGNPYLPWEEIPGYVEVHVKAGDVMFFTEDLYHGAQEITTDRTRRTLFLGYGPYEIGNYNGVRYSEDLLLRANPVQRELLGGPFMGVRHGNLPLENYPTSPEFNYIPDRPGFVWKKED